MPDVPDATGVSHPATGGAVPIRPGNAVIRVDRPQRPVAVGTVVSELLDVAFGLVALAVDAVSTGLDGQLRDAPPMVPARMLVDAGLGVCWDMTMLGGRLARSAADLVRPVAGFAMDPPVLPGQLRPISGLRALAERSQRQQRRSAAALLDRSLTIDLTGVVEQVVLRLDLDRLVADVVSRIDLDAVVREALEVLDVDSAATQALGAVDLDGLVAAVVSRLDLDAVVGVALAHLDLSKVVSAALQQLDLTELVVGHVDLEQVVNTVLDGMDLTTVALERVDLGRVVDGALDSINLTDLVMQRVDLVSVAEYVVEEIDLPGIIRESTGSVASEAVRGVRRQGVEADDVLGRTVDRLLRRSRARDRATPVDQSGGTE